MGTVNFAGDLGKMVAPLGALLAISFGWRAAVGAVGLAGLVFMAASLPTRRAVDIGRPEPRPHEIGAEGTGKSRMGGFALLSLVGFLDSGGFPGVPPLYHGCQGLEGFIDNRIGGFLNYRHSSSLTFHLLLNGIY